MSELSGLKFDDTLVAWKLQASGAREVILHLAGLLQSAGHVAPEYGEMAWQRELHHPPGLPTRPFCIAFPHADADGVIHSALALASLEHDVNFKNMADPDEDLAVSLVIMLANNNPTEQVQTLRNLAILFGEPEKLAALRDLSSPDAAAAWLTQELGLQ